MSTSSQLSSNRSRGFGLMETLLVLGAISVMSLAVYGIFFSSDVAAEVKAEQNNLNSLSTAIDRSFGLTGGFGGLSMQELTAEKLLPAAYSQSGSPSTKWGGNVAVRPNAVGHANDSFVIEYSQVPSTACAKLASAMAPNVYDIRIGGTSVMPPTSGFSPAAAATACSRANAAQMEFVYYSGLTSGSAVATPSLTLPPAPPSVDPASPTTPTGPVAGAPSVDDATPGTPGVVPPGTPVTPPPVAPVVPPAPSAPVSPPSIPSVTPTTPPSVARCVAPGAIVGTQQVACLAGQYGLTQQQRTGTYTCPEAWDSPVLTWGSWVNASSSCTTCPPPGQEATAQWVGASAACPSGQTGTHTWEKEQRATRNYSYNCPAGTTSLPAPSFGGWSAWQDTGAVRNVVNTCKSSVTWRWDSVDVVYGPGSGCNLGADQDRADQDAAAGVLIKHGVRPYASYDVNEANYPCNEAALGSVITVYGGCGGWQAGLEGWSGYQCRPQGDYYVWNAMGGDTYGAEVYRGTNPSSSPYFAQAVAGYTAPTAACTAANAGQVVRSNSYTVIWQGVGANRYATIREISSQFECGFWTPSF